MSVNKVILVGRLGADPELRYLPSGRPLCRLRVATNRSYKDKDGNRQQQTDWHRVAAWGKQGEICERHLKKGGQVYIEGRLSHRSYEDREGNKRYYTEVVSDSVTFLGGGGRRPGDEPHEPYEPPGPPAPAPAPEPTPDELPF